MGVVDPCKKTSEEERRMYQKLQDEENRQAEKVVQQLIPLTKKGLITWQKERFSNGYITQWNDIEVKLTPGFSHSDFPDCHRLFSLNLDFSPPQSPFPIGIQGILHPKYKFPNKGLAILETQAEITKIKEYGPFRSLKKLYGLVAPVCENNWWLQSYGVQAKEILKRLNVSLEDKSSVKKMQETIVKATINKAEGMNWAKAGERRYQTQFNGMEISLLLFDDYIGMNLASLEIKLLGEEFSLRLEGEIKKGHSYNFTEGFFFLVPIEFNTRRKVFPDRKVGFWDDLKDLYYRIQKRASKEEQSRKEGEIVGKTAKLLAKLKI